jgi:hypothetical protein
VDKEARKGIAHPNEYTLNTCSSLTKGRNDNITNAGGD